MKLKSEPSPLPSAAVPSDVRVLTELNAIRGALERLNQAMARIAETLERAANRR